MTIPGFQDLMLPVLRELDQSGELRTTELVARMAELFELSSEDRAAMLPSGRQTVIANRTHWAITYLNKTALIERTRRAHYRIASRGREALASGIERVDLKYLERYAELARFRGDRDERAVETAEEVASSTNLPPNELLRSSFAAIQADLREQVLERVIRSDPTFFERLVVQLLVAMGFGRGLEDPGRAIGGSGDQGLDGVIDQDSLGLDRVYIQAKRYAAGKGISAAAIRDFSGGLDMAKAAKGVFITTSSFTPAAQQAAERLSKRIVLIDGEQLATLMIRHDVGVRIEETLHLKRVDEDFFGDEA